MSIPIIPPSSPSDPHALSTPSVTSGSNPAASANPIDFFETSLAQSLSPPAVDASNPRISIARFYGSIASANLAQQLREYLDNINDPQFRKALMQFAIDQASYMAEVITLVYQYDSLNNQLNNLDLPTKAGKINSALTAYSSGVAADNAAIDAINNAGIAYNTAQSDYQAALLAYQTALNSYNSAQTTYNTALAAWNTALSAYQGGSITQAQLEAARTTFQTASDQFTSAQASFTTAQSTFDAAESAWNSASATYAAAVSDYNTYVASRSSALNDVNTAINDWNATYGQAAGLVTQMNTIRSQLGLTPLSSTTTISPITGLSTVTAPSGPSTITTSVQTTVDQNNNSIKSINTLIGTIGGQVTAINASGYTPALTTPATLVTIPGLPTTDSDSSADTSIPYESVPSSVTITPPANEDLVSTYLLPRIAILAQTQKQSAREDQFRDDTNNPFVDQVSGLSIISAGSGGSVLNVANSTGTSKSPFLNEILSKHAFEAMLNVFGVPAGSALVDQIGALYKQVETNAGLASAGPANQILNNAALSGSNGQTAVTAAVALGNLSVVQEIAEGDNLKEAISNLVNSDPTLANLTPEQKTALITTINGEIGASLIKTALNEVATALGLPGLTPQILAILAGLTEHDPLASFSQQLYQNVLFAEQLAKEFQLTAAQANALVANAVQQQAQNAQAASVSTNSTQQTDQQTADADAEQASIEQSVTDQLVKTGLDRAEVQEKVQNAAAVASDGVQQELLKADIAKSAAFKDSLLKSFALLELDPVKADLLAAQIPVASINEITTLLINKGLTLPEANQVAQNALNAAQLKDPNSNPLSSFLVQQLGTKTEMAGLLKWQIVNILSPAVGMRNALSVGETYGSKVFTSANAATNILLANERRLDAISSFIHDVRLNEDYRNATVRYRSPELDPDSPLKLGKTLLLAGIPGGLSNQGLTSQDNTVGPSANQSKHATSYPGIFG